jgi:hypothetical protein
MRKRRLACWVATASLLAACATGVDSQPGLSDGDDSGAVEASSGAGHDAGSSSSSGGRDSSAVFQDTGTTAPDSGSSGNDASSGDDSSSTQDTGTVSADTGTGQDTGTTSGGVCGSDAKYSIEAAAEVLSGTITFCFSGVCAAGKCCYEQVSPGNVCVAE